MLCKAIIKLTIILSSMSVISLVQPASADNQAKCVAELRAMLVEDTTSVFPYALEWTTHTDGLLSSKTSGIVAALDHSLTYVDQTNSWYVHKGRQNYLSNDKGRTWAKTHSSDEATYTKIMDGVKKQAETLESVECTDSVERDDKTYRSLKGIYTAQVGVVGTKISIEFLVDENNVWQISVAKQDSMGKRITVTSTKTPDVSTADILKWTAPVE